MESRDSQLSLREKISYAVGDTGFNFFWKNIEVYLMFFYTDVFGISAAAAGTMFLVTKLIDAFTDPMMGMLADRTQSKLGRFRPYLLWGALPLAAAGVLTYTTPNLGDDGKLIWAYCTYIFMMLAYTFVNIPYSAMLGVITGNTQQRTVLTSYRFVAAFTGGIVVTWCTPKLVDLLGQGNEKLGWQLAMACYGVAAAALFVWSFLNTKERVVQVKSTNNTPLQDLKDLLSNRPWLVLFALGLVVIMTISLRNAASAYYFKYYLNQAELMGAFLTATMIAYAIGAAATPMLTRLMDKKSLFIVLMSLVALLSAAMYFVPPDSVTLVFVFGVLISLALGPKSPLVWSMYADTADYSEWKTGRRATGLVFSAATFALKLGGALASATIGWMLASMGYEANQVQTIEATNSIVLLVTAIPAFFAAVAALIATRYSLSNTQLVHIQKELVARS
ncbi:glycoside-pentoside-hexuronide (GPH):cation symporter [Echinimonas agarilytica]|uniref:MFS transporter n=1 Tax=Echinimonas agarilytica TaxID=1215918 RepID=A0AA41W9N7_9GAMM|nr:MFS transporter [Echinimonas agarilytica]MCM2681211.1 MFS transporter [Echinimonas agarilytica]